MAQRVIVACAEGCFIEPCPTIRHARRVIAFYSLMGFNAHLL